MRRIADSQKGCRIERRKGTRNGNGKERKGRGVYIRNAITAWMICGGFSSAYLSGSFRPETPKKNPFDRTTACLPAERHRSSIIHTIYLLIPLLPATYDLKDNIIIIINNNKKEKEKEKKKAAGVKLSLIHPSINSSIFIHHQSSSSSAATMPNPSQLFLLADHIRLSLLERQRAVSLGLDPNSQDDDISRSLDSLGDGIRTADSEYARLQQENNGDAAADFKDQLDKVRQQLGELSSQFYGVPQPSSTPDIRQPVPQHPPSKSVRFTNTQHNVDDEDDVSRHALFQPYRDSPSPPSATADISPDMTNQQIHEQHSQVIRDQDDQLDRLGESIGRQHQLSIQIGDELEGHVALLDGMDADVERHQTRLDQAKRRLSKVRKVAGDNCSMMTIIGLIIVLVILIVILK